MWHRTNAPHYYCTVQIPTVGGGEFVTVLHIVQYKAQYSTEANLNIIIV